MIIFLIWSASPSPSLLSSPSPLIDSIAVSVFADIFIELTNTEMAATTLWALEWMWEIIQKWSWDWTEDLAKNRAGFVKNSTGFLAIIQLVFATANLDWDVLQGLSVFVMRVWFFLCKFHCRALWELREARPPKKGFMMPQKVGFSTFHGSGLPGLPTLSISAGLPLLQNSCRYWWCWEPGRPDGGGG